MNDTVEAKPESLGGLAQQLTDQATTLRDELDKARKQIVIPEGAFGVVSGVESDDE